MSLEFNEANLQFRNSFNQSSHTRRKLQEGSHKDAGKTGTGLGEISAFDKLESLRMDQQILKESLFQMCAIIEESVPDESRGEDYDEIIMRVPCDTWSKMKELASFHLNQFSKIIEESNFLEDRVGELDGKLSKLVANGHQQEVEQKRRNELQKVATQIKEKEFIRSLSEIRNCFDSGRKMLTADLRRMEKTVKSMRRTRRHLRANRITMLQNVEMEMEDMMSSSEDPFGQSAASVLTEKEVRIRKHSPISINREINLVKVNTHRTEPHSIEVPAKEFAEDANESLIPKMGLGGVLLNTNGDPIGNGTGEWMSAYDDDSHIQESSGFIEFVNNHKAYQEAENSVEKSLLLPILAEGYRLSKSKVREEEIEHSRKLDSTTPQKQIKKIQEEEKASHLKELSEKQKENTFGEELKIEEKKSKNAQKVHFISSKGNTRELKQEIPDTNNFEEARLEEILAIPSKNAFERPLPPLQPGEQPKNKEKFNHITSADLLDSDMENSLPFSMPSTSEINFQETNKEGTINQSQAINVIDYNGSGKDTVTCHRLSMDNEELISEKEESGNVHEVLFEASAEQNSSQKTPFQRVRPPSLSSRASEKNSSYKVVQSFRSARERDEKFKSKPRPPLVLPVDSRCEKSNGLTSMEEEKENVFEKDETNFKYTNEEFATQERGSAIDTGKQRLSFETPIQTRPYTPNLLSMKRITNANVLTTGSQATGDYSTNNTIEPSRIFGKYIGAVQIKIGKPDTISNLFNPAFLSQLKEEQTSSENLTFSTHQQTKGSLYQSFYASKPTLSRADQDRSAILDYSRVSNETAEGIKILRIKKKNILPVGKSQSPFSKIRLKHGMQGRKVIA